MRFYRRASRLQAVSHAVAEAIASQAPRLASLVRVIPYPLIEDSSPNSVPSIAEERERRILFVGRLHPEKGVHLLLKALATFPRGRLDGWRVEIVGPHEVRLGGGGAEYWRGLQELAKPIAASIEWAGPVFDSARLAAIYRSASIFVYPSLADRGETFGLAPLEAMSHGCAPIVSNLACFRDFIDDREEGLTFDHQSRAPEIQLAARLRQLMDDPTLCKRTGIAALRKARQYALPRVTAAFLDDFQSLA
jgi:glycosyltransferase involved in cell wall biosynthesis